MKIHGRLLWVAAFARVLAASPAPAAWESGKHVVQVGRTLGAGGIQAGLSVKAIAAGF